MTGSAVQMVAGFVLGVEVNPPSGGRTWEEQQIVLKGRSVASPVVITIGDRFEGDVPTDGEFVVLEVSPRAWPTKGGGAAWSLNGWRRLVDVERALSGSK